VHQFLQPLVGLRDVLKSDVTQAHGQLGLELATLRDLFEMTHKEKLATAEEEHIQQQRQLDENADSIVLRHICFETLRTLRGDIAEAHKNTFAWMF